MVMAPRPIRETSRPPRCAFFISDSWVQGCEVGIAHSSAMEERRRCPRAATASRERLFTSTEKSLLEGVLTAHHSPVRSRSIACDEGHGQVDLTVSLET